jgi:hypothetical protein
MAPRHGDGHIMETRLQDIYWAELVQLKVGCEYIRRYRDSLGAFIL